MNIGEANATMNALRFIKGDIDHCDETTRAAVARDLLWLQTRANAALGAGLRLDEAAWNEALCLITFEADSSDIELALITPGVTA